MSCPVNGSSESFVSSALITCLFSKIIDHRIEKNSRPQKLTGSVVCLMPVQV